MKLESFIYRLKTKPGYKFLLVIGVFAVFFYILDKTAPVVVINENNEVIMVDCKPTYRELLPFDYRESKIIKESEFDYKTCESK